MNHPNEVKNGMQTEQNTPHQHHHVRLDSAGRVVIPAELRRRWHLDKGDTLLLVEEPSGVRMQTMKQVVQESQAYFRQFIPAGVSLVDELIAERRAEAARE